jgi:E3 ubiquitin-protein ligase TRIP12
MVSSSSVDRVQFMLSIVADSKRSSPSLLARQLRLRLVADDDSDIPRNLHNIVVSIHAIATFQALHDYLRPRVAGLLLGGSRLSGILAALAASGFEPSSSQTAAEELRQLVSASNVTAPTPTAAETSTPTRSLSASGIVHRRSQ